MRSDGSGVDLGKRREHRRVVGMAMPGLQEFVCGTRTGAKKVEKSCRGGLTGFCACEVARHRTFQPLPDSEKLTCPCGCTAPRSARAAGRFSAGRGREEDVYLKTGSIFTA